MVILKPCAVVLGAACASRTSRTSLPPLTFFGARHLPPCPHSYSPSQPSLQLPPSHRRTYATAQDTDSKSSSSNADHDVPAWPRTPHPTPYELLGIAKGAIYNKRHFYQLVKLYHPDTHDSVSTHASHNLSHDIRLERYRLIVAANELLSDPAKRRLYDTHGLGWSQGGGSASPACSPSPRDADSSWRYQSGSAVNNATWEDWERWNDVREGRRNEPVFMSNGMFASIVVVLIIVCGLWQVIRAEESGEKYVDWTTKQTVEIGAELRSNLLAAEGCSKDERVGMFLRERENVTYKYKPSKYDRPPRNRPS